MNPYQKQANVYRKASVNTQNNFAEETTNSTLIKALILIIFI